MRNSLFGKSDYLSLSLWVEDEDIDTGCEPGNIQSLSRDSAGFDDQLAGCCKNGDILWCGCIFCLNIEPVVHRVWINGKSDFFGL